MIKDPIVEELRANAEKIAIKYNHDPVKYALHLKRIQKKYGGRLVSFAGKTGKRQQGAATGKGRKARTSAD